jgi:dolichol-phosphate mannosyltransferase
MRVCIIIPMYNEAAIARHSLETILPYVRELPPVVRVLVVNDGSEDATEQIVQAVVKEQPDDLVRLVSHPQNAGYGAALRTGIRYAIDHRYDYALFMDSDLTNHPKYLKDFYAKMQEGWDYIKATRHSKGGGYHGVPWERRVISRLGNRLAKVISGLPLNDSTNGFRAVKIEILKRLELRENSFAIIIEELTQSKRYTDSYCEIPNILGNRSQEARPTSFSYDFRTYWKYFRYLF